MFITSKDSRRSIFTVYELYPFKNMLSPTLSRNQGQELPNRAPIGSTVNTFYSNTSCPGLSNSMNNILILQMRKLKCRYLKCNFFKIIQALWWICTLIVLTSKHMFFFFFFLRHLKIFTMNILVALGLHCCVQAFSSFRAWDYSLVEVCRISVAVAALVEHRLYVHGLR